MATTYGYGGEFSSDEDLDKLEQSTEKLNKFDANQQHIKPTKNQIEQTIEDIRQMPIEMDFEVSDDLLAGLLDYYKTQRGPIVDSTRKLYKKIVLRLVRGDSSHQQAGANNDNTNGSNGNTNSNNNNNNNDNNNPVVHRPVQAADSFSSDDDDELVISALNKRKQVPYGTENNNIITVDDKVDADCDVMEVDPVETPSGPVRGGKPVDIPTTTTDEDSGEETDESGNSDESDSILEVTPIKPHGGRGQVTIMNNDAQKDDINSVIPKQPESSVKRQQPIAQSTPKESLDSVKKPYTRSQRMAAARVAAAKDGGAIDHVATLGKTQVSSASSSGSIAPRRRMYSILTVSVVVGLLAFALYYFQSNLIKSTEPLFKRKITF